MEMLSQKNKDIKKAYDMLQVISKDEKARMAYEAREAEIHDQMTRIETAREEGAKKKAIKIAQNLLKMGFVIEQVAKASELSVEEVEEIKKKMIH
jgi:predicted transposase/invertase (TIGR01784 family)